MATIEVVLFDLDGTLVDSNDAHVAVWERVLREGGHPRDRAAIHAQIGKGGDNFIPALIPAADAAERKRLSERHGTVFKEEHLEAIRPFRHAHDLLAALHARGVRVALASSAGEEDVRHYVGLLDAGGILAATTSKDEAAHSKPDPDIFAAALEATGVAAEKAIVVGDTPWDVIAANRCGIRTVAVLSGGFEEAALREAGAIAIYRDVADLLANIETSPLVA